MVEIKAICCALTKDKILNNFFYNYHDRSYIESTSKIVGVEKRFWKVSGSVIITSSVSSISANLVMLAYSSAKSPLVGMLKPMVLELSNFNVRINALVLGAVKIDMHQRLIKI